MISHNSTARYPRTPLDAWTLSRIDMSSPGPLTKEQIDRYHLSKLKELIDYLRTNSPFYRQHLGSIGDYRLKSLGDVGALPFTTAEDLIRAGLKLLCVSNDEVARIVTLRTSGTTGPSKRLYFTTGDLERTIDFFHNGMATLVEPGQRVLIFLPGEKPDSVGDLLRRGLERLGVQGIIHGPVRDVDRAITDIVRHSPDCLVGIPTQVLRIARTAGGTIPKGTLTSVLLSTDYVPKSITRELERLWGCPVFNHYGTTEMGLGGAVECAAHAGCHIREFDLYVEIVDPDTGRVCPEGERGEIVVTTLTRKGMPLLRYRTGDISRLLAGPCACGSHLKRLDPVIVRRSHLVSIGANQTLCLAELDEALFPLPGIINFNAEVSSIDRLEALTVTLFCADRHEGLTKARVFDALMAVDSIRRSVEEGTLMIKPPRIADEDWFTTGVAKRTIIDNR